MRAGAEGDAVAGVAADVELRRRCSKCFSSRLAEPNIRNTRSLVSNVTSRIVQGFAIRRGDMPIGEIQRAYSSNACSHGHRARRGASAQLIGMGQQRPAPCRRSRRAARSGRREIASLMLARMLSIGMSVCKHHAQHALSRVFSQHRHHVVDRGIDPCCRRVASRLGGGIAGVVGDAVDHRPATTRSCPGSACW